MNQTLKSIKLLSLVFIGILLFNACSNDNDIDNPIDNEFLFNLYLTDCPFDAEEVNVQILSVYLEDINGEEDTLTTNSGIYNLLDFSNGIDTLLAYGDIDLDDIKHIFFELGEDNSIVIDDQTFPLELKNGQIVKVNVNINQLDEDEDFLVDFFACTSIIQNNNEYFLKPVIKFKGPKNNNSEDDLIEDLIEDIEECYALVYPITVLDEDNESFTAENDEELIDILNDNNIVELVYPISVTDEDGNTITLSSEQDIDLLEDCEDDDEEEIDNEDTEEILEELSECLTIDFPISFVLENGDIIEVNDEIELEDLLDSEEIVDFNYPVNLFDENGNSLSAGDNEELEELAECEEDEEDSEFEELLEELEECYDIVYPVEVVDADGNNYVVNNDAELEEVSENNELVDFNYPISIEDENGNLSEIQNINQLEMLEDDCDEDDDHDLIELVEELEDCYDFVYPLTLVDANGNTFTASDSDGLNEILNMNANNLIDFVYPIELVDEDENNIEINSIEELEELETDC